jgi:hypothetical protein
MYRVNTEREMQGEAIGGEDEREEQTPSRLLCKDK